MKSAAEIRNFKPSISNYRLQRVYIELVLSGSLVEYKKSDYLQEASESLIYTEINGASFVYCDDSYAIRCRFSSCSRICTIYSNIN